MYNRKIKNIMIIEELVEAAIQNCSGKKEAHKICAKSLNDDGCFRTCCYKIGNRAIYLYAVYM